MTTDTTRPRPMIELDITGMTCASCANRIERKLNKLDGVSATVNYATERATVTAPVAVDHETLIGTVAAAGYGATVRRPAGTAEPTSDAGVGGSSADPELRALRDRLIWAVILTVPVIAVAMVPALQFEYWQWASLTLAAPVATWGAWPFHRAAWTNLRHGSTTMDTLVSLGVVGTGRGAQLGILIRGPEVLEATRAVDTVVLDKTGTVTTGDMRLTEVVADGALADDVRRIAATLESASEHPIARAIAAGTPTGTLTDFANEPGLGVTGVVVGWSGRAHGVLVVADTVEESSAEAVRRLRALGLSPVLLTGDNERTARAVASEVGIDEVRAGVLPADKVAFVHGLQEQERVVAMVGDGVNDAAALAQADLGIAMGTGTDVAREASDLTIVSGDLRVAADAVRLSRRTLGTIRGNLFWAFAYNVAALPLAAAALLNPMLAGAARAASSVFVVTNSLRLRGFRPER